MNNMEQTDEERLDKYLWSIRVFKTRSEAAEACKSGKIKVNGTEAKASRSIKAGDLLEIRKGCVHFVYKVLVPVGNRQGAKNVPLYAEDRTPESEKQKLEAPNETIFMYRKRGEGRPTKKDRRMLDKLMGN